jgi:protein-L-isoaspartate(D-aspartate) O-methyltransferase
LRHPGIVLRVASGGAADALRFAGVCRTNPENCRPGNERMIDFAEARHMMVDGQVRTYDVTDLRVLAAMLEIPREHFVPEDKQALAYADRDQVVANAKDGRAARYLLKPAVLARLVQEAEIAETDRVLDVGCATGYSSAILSKLAGTVFALEDDPRLASVAKEKLAALGATNVMVATGALTAGAPAHAPYDVILLNGATEVVPQGLCRQLKNGGRLACVFGRSPGRATIYRSGSGHVTGHAVFDAAAPLLPGFAKPPGFVF